MSRYQKEAKLPWRASLSSDPPIFSTGLSRDHHLQLFEIYKRNTEADEAASHEKQNLESERAKLELKEAKLELEKAE